MNLNWLEFIPYAFQTFSALLAHHEGKGVPEEFKPILASLLQPNLWESHANVPALSRLLREYLVCDPAFVLAEYLQAYLGVFQKLVNFRHSEFHAFYLAGTIVDVAPL